MGGEYAALVMVKRPSKVATSKNAVFIRYEWLWIKNVDKDIKDVIESTFEFNLIKNSLRNSS